MGKQKRVKIFRWTIPVFFVLQLIVGVFFNNSYCDKLCGPVLALAQMQELGDGQLDGVTGQSGISIGVSNFQFYAFQPYLRYTDTDTGNSLQFSNMTISNGQGGLMGLNVGCADQGGDGLISPLNIDVFMNPDGYIMAGFQALDWEQEVGVDVDEVLFCGQSLGSLHWGPVQIPSWQLYLAPHGGIDFEYDFSQHWSDVDYLYREDDPGSSQDESQSLTLQDIYLVQSFTQNANDDPADPATWQSSGLFKIGDLNVDGQSSYQPAQIDVGTDPQTQLAQVAMSLPMSGSLRIADLSVGGTSFGPIAVDNIQVHRLLVRFIP